LRGNRSRRETQTSLSQAILSSFSWESRGIPRPEEMYKPSREFWISQQSVPDGILISPEPLHLTPFDVEE